MSVKIPVVARSVMTAIGKGGVGILHVRGGGGGGRRCHSCWDGHSEDLRLEIKGQVQGNVKLMRQRRRIDGCA